MGAYPKNAIRFEVVCRSPAIIKTKKTCETVMYTYYHYHLLNITGRLTRLGNATSQKILRTWKI